MKAIVTMLVTFLVMISLIAFAQDNQRGDGPSRKSPPPEAIAACENSASGDVCSFTSPHGELNGTCRIPPKQEELACVPKNHPRGQHPKGKGQQDDR